MPNACDSNGCDLGTKKCNIAHCIKIDDVNYDTKHGNVKDLVGKYIMASMETKESTIDDCTSSGCGFLPAVTYKIPGYISLRRNYDSGDPNILYKISISTSESKDACDIVFSVLSAATSGLEGPNLFGIMKIVGCQ